MQIKKVIIEKLPIDSRQLIDMADFDFVIQQLPCNDQVKTLVIVHSLAENFEHRDLIRITWLKYTGPRHLHIIFAIGVPSDIARYQETIKEEADLYGDIIQGNFNDDFKKLSYKHVMGLKWFAQYCSNARLLLKVEDDVFVNTMLDFRQFTLMFRLEIPFIMCYQNNRVVDRDNSSQWYVSKEEYQSEKYPHYCDGSVILYSKRAVLDLYKASIKSKYFWIDDIFVTGFLREKLQIPIVSSMNFEVENVEQDIFSQSHSNINDAKRVFNFLVAKNISPQDRFKLWHIIEDAQNLDH